MTQVVKGGVLAVVFAQFGLLFVYGLNSLTSLCLSAVGFAALAWAAWRYRRPVHAPSTDVGLIMNPSPRRFILSALLLTSAITVVAAAVGWLEGPAPGWQPLSMSRGGLTRIGDWLASLYAFGMVGVLLASLIYCLACCIEFSRFAKQHVSREFADPEEPGPQMESEKDRLWLIGQLTSVTSGLAPAVMGLLLVLVVAYHPVISPTPMPMGLLAVITIALAFFVAPMLLVRWYFNGDRQEVLLELQKQLSALPRAGGAPPQRSTDAQASALNPPEGDSGESERVLVLPSGEMSVNESEEQPLGSVQQSQFKRTLPAAAIHPHEDRKQQLEACKQQIEALSDGVFRPWAQAPVGWILGGGASLALIDLWIRWWTLGV